MPHSGPALIVVGPVAAAGHTSKDHPERTARVAAAMAGLEDLHLGDDLLVIDAEPAPRADVLRVHTEVHLERVAHGVAAATTHRPVALDADTFVTPTSLDDALLAAGAGLVAISAAERLRTPAFVPVRPPGHHALADRAMGFCLLNTVAVAAAALRDGGDRVVIVDWDVHHGNGTEAIFYDDPDVLYVSTHQGPFYPGTGAPEDVGAGRGRGTTVNVPLPAGATGDVVLAAFEEVVTPAVERFRPDWVLISAGFDAHRADPLAQLQLSSGDFARVMALVAGYAPHPGRIVLFLEGGYDLTALRSSVRATLAELVGAGDPDREAPTEGGPGREHVTRAQQLRRQALVGSDPAPP